MTSGKRWSARRLCRGIVFVASLLAVCAPSAYADDNYADLVARVLPSVVSITVRKSVPVQGTSERRDSGIYIMGSGFIIDPSGYVVTNRHVVLDAYSIVIAMSDGKRLAAHVVGHPPATDIALLKVEPDHPLPTVTFGDSDQVRVGEKVLAIGNPLGLGGTVTSGIVSALNRNTLDTPYDNYIQTDAAINHGNSGGPLFDLNGKVIGVNTEIISPGEGSAGLGFALPSNDVRFAVTELRDFGRVRPGWIGAHIQEITPELASAFGASSTHGALVSTVPAGSPAAAAGLRPGDVIVGFGDRAPTDARALMRMIAESPLDTTVALTVRRGAAAMQVPVTMREYPQAMMAANYPFELTAAPSDNGDPGLRLGPLDPATRAQVALPAGVSGVLVTLVPPGSAADRAGLRVKDVILQVGSDAATNPESAQRLVQQIRKAGQSEAGLLVADTSGQHWVALSTGAASSN